MSDLRDAIVNWFEQELTHAAFESKTDDELADAILALPEMVVLLDQARCGSERGRFVCTLPAGHPGEHVQQVVLASWSNDNDEDTA